MAESTLIDARSLREALNDAPLILFDCRFSLADPARGRQLYAQGHLPGAFHADLDRHLSAPITRSSGRHPLPDPSRLAAWLARCGVSADSQVVVYDDVGGAFAARLWWLLRWIGQGSVALLDGGLQAWLAIGGDLVVEEPQRPAGDLIARPADELWIGTEALVSALPTGAPILVDARAPERFRGEVEPIDPVAGHIPGARNRPFADNLDAQGRFLPPDVLRAAFRSVLSQAAPNRVVHTCGSGVNACHNLLAMEHAGLSGSRLYPGSWSEWIRDSARPIAVGPD
jgi:thiosulfate/3-mercaptopyruvate sulfurtransferase